MFSTAAVNVGNKTSPISIRTDSVADPSRFMAPCAEEFIVLAICAAAPSASPRPAVSFSSFPLLVASIRANMPAAASVPKILDMFSICSAAPMPSICFVRAFMMSGIVRRLPLASLAETPRASKASAVALGSLLSLIKAARRAVPDSDPLMPASPIAPIIAVVSSSGIFKAAATGATIFIDSPRLAILVFVDEEAFAKTSETLED